MAFPDDYRRVAQAGGNKATVDSHLGIPRQLIIDTESGNIRLMDGVTPGGKPVAMTAELPSQMQANIPAGEVSYVEDPANDIDQLKLLWKSLTLRNLFLKLADMTDTVNWLVKNEALPERLRRDSVLISDANLALANGWYRFNPNNTSNLPGDLPTGDSAQYMMQVIRQSSSELTQLIFSRREDGKIWMRSRIAAAWKAWALATGVTAGDLATKVSKTGDTMTGRLVTRIPANVVNGAQLNLREGVTPVTPENGDIWREAGGIKFRKGGVTVDLVDSSVSVTKKRARIGCMRAAGAVGLSLWGSSSSTSIPSGTEVKRSINTEFSDPDSIVTISNNDFTLSGASLFKLLIDMSVHAHGVPSTSTQLAFCHLLSLYSITNAAYVTNVGGANALQTIAGSTGVKAGSGGNLTLFAEVPPGIYAVFHRVYLAGSGSTAALPWAFREGPEYGLAGGQITFLNIEIEEA